MPMTQNDALQDAIVQWMKKLRKYPGWRKWKRQHLGHTLFRDDPIRAEPFEPQFKFSEDVEKQHSLIMCCLRLRDTLSSLKDCEFYFRRYPFNGLPVTKHTHLVTICEMYFAKFYEFKERLKQFFDAFKKFNPEHKAEFGRFLKSFEKAFDTELRERNRIHHHERFSDASLERVFLTETFMLQKKEEHWARTHRFHYNKLSREWAQRVKKRSADVERFLEALADFTLKNCDFLQFPKSKNRAKLASGANR